MDGELKDVAVIIDGENQLADAIQAGAALQLARHHGSRINVFEQGEHDQASQVDWNDDFELPAYAGVEICGIDQRISERERLHSPLLELWHKARQGGSWTKGADASDLLQALHCADLIIAGSPLTADSKGRPDIDDIVARAGRPVLVLPRQFAQRRERRIGNHVLVVWNATAHAARALHDAMPFLHRAEEVTVLYVNEHHHGRRKAKEGATAITDHLFRHGVTARSEIIQVASAQSPNIVLDRLTKFDVNLLVMGAFGRSKLAELFWGDPSEEIIHAVDVPVLTSH